MNIDLNMTIKELLEQIPEAKSLLHSYGLGKFEKDEVVKSLGSVLKVRSALNMAQSDPQSFADAVAELVKETDGDFAENYSNQKSLSMLGLLPCGMKMPFKRRFEEFYAELPNKSELNCLIEGNVNHELSYYPYIDTLEEIDELPDVIVSADINSFLHKGFYEKFIKTGYFEAVKMNSDNQDFAGTDYLNPDGAYTMLSANILVIVENKNLSSGIKRPNKWSDLLLPVFENSVTMRGQNNFFCSGVLLPFYKDYGEAGIHDMARTVKAGLHPAEMVEEIERGKGGTPFYIMPLFFAQRLKDPDKFSIIYPEEGAIISPVFMLVKKNRKTDAAVIADFIVNKEMGQFCANAGFPSVRSDVNNHLPEGCKLSWMGWDFLRGEDPLIVKQKIEDIFSTYFTHE